MRPPGYADFRNLDLKNLSDAYFIEDIFNGFDAV